jgi:hypothetical protein
MDVPVPAAKQLLQGSSSLLNLSHLLLVFRHWSQAKERDSWDEWVTGQLVRTSAAPFPVGSLSWVLFVVGQVKVRKGRLYGHGKKEGRSHTILVINSARSRSQSRPCPGSWLGKKCGAGQKAPPFWSFYVPLRHVVQSPFLIFIFHCKRMLMGHAPVPPCSQYPSYRDRFAVMVSELNVNGRSRYIRRLESPQSCIVPSVLWDARVAK